MKKLFLFIKILSPKKTKQTKRATMKVKNITVESINKDFSSFGGIKIYDLIYKSLNLRDIISPLLPAKNKKSETSQEKKFKSLIFKFICGGDCLDDLDWLRLDTIFSTITNGGIASTTAGEFLRSFKNRAIENLEDKLIELALSLRKAIHPHNNNFELSIDSTPHVQRGLKMEGLEYDYKNNWGLNSLNSYDQFGFSYGFQLRPGGTYSGNGASTMVGNIFRKVGNTMNKYLLGDSAFCNLSVMNTCMNHNAKFALAMKENVYRPILEKNKNLIKWKKTRMNFFDSNECEIANAIYPKKGLVGGISVLRVVFIRALKGDGYKYYAICTNIFQHEWSGEKIIKFYRGRANCENFIKEQKYGFDFKHFPCKKLNANRVYGLIGTIAYNMMRMTSFLISKKGCLSKKIRKTLLEIPCQLVSHARRLTIKMNYKRKEVFDRCFEKLIVVFRKVTMNST